MSDLIEYRRAIIEDVPQLVNLRSMFLRELMDPKPKENEIVQLENQLREYFKEKFFSTDLIIWLAVVDKIVVATSTMVIYQVPIGFGGIGKNGKGYILNMFTLEGYRKKGIGTKLLKHLLTEAKTRNLEIVHLHATEIGSKIYRSMGFNPPLYPELKMEIV